MSFHSNSEVSLNCNGWIFRAISFSVNVIFYQKSFRYYGVNSTIYLMNFDARDLEKTFSWIIIFKWNNNQSKNSFWRTFFSKHSTVILKIPLFFPKKFWCWINLAWKTNSLRCWSGSGWDQMEFSDSDRLACYMHVKFVCSAVNHTTRYLKQFR